MMNFFQRLLLVCCLALVTHTTLSAQTTIFKAFLSGHNEVLPVASSAYGEVIAELTGNELVVTGYFFDLSGMFNASVAGGAHIHTGYAGQGGGIAISLNTTLGVDLRSGGFEALLNTFTLTSEQIDALMSRQFYINVHSTTYPSGEIRGQLQPVSDAYFSTTLFGSNETPAIITGAGGALVMELTGDQLTVTGSFANLESDFNAAVAGGAHLHLGRAGEMGDIQVSLSANVDVDQRSGFFDAAHNTFTLTPDQIEALHARAIYANIHTMDHPSGELRGQIAGTADAVFRAHFSGAEELPVVTSDASGVIMAEINGDSLFVSGSFTGLESEIATAVAGGAHIHAGRAGAAGGIVFPLTPTINPDQRSGIFEVAYNRFAITAEQKATLVARGMYANIHSTAFTGGEIRGQLLPESQYAFTAMMSGIFETLSAVSRANGTVKAELSGHTLTVSGTFDNLGSAFNPAIAGGAHLHLAIAGSAGGISFPLVTVPDADLGGGYFAAETNAFTLSDEQVEAIRERRFYVNVHTVNRPSGEIRGQLLGEANYYFTAPLSGAGETPAINTGATGMVIFEITGQQAVCTGSFNGLASDFAANIAGGAHIHTGLAGQAGGISIGLDVTAGADNRSGTFEVGDNVYTLTTDQIFAFRNRNFYVNVHSVDHASGEIRGQCLPVSTAYLTATLSGINEVQPNTSSSLGAIRLELNGAQLVVSGSFAGLSSAFNAAIAGGAHLHLGAPGQNGGIAIPLTVNPSVDMLSGTFAAADNVFSLTPEQVANLTSGSYYANVHTMGYAGGEIRGQSLPEINFFPSSAPAVTAPLDGTDILLEGATGTSFQVEWLPSADATALAYIWQLSTAADFSTILAQRNVGNNLIFTSTYANIDALLEGAGVSVGNTITLYHRVLASDGSLVTAGVAASVNITRGVVADQEIFHARLTGHNEVLPVLTLASGEITATLTNDQLAISGGFSGLQGDLATNIAGGAHIHLGYAGQAGPIWFPLTVTPGPDTHSGSFDPANNTFTLSTGQIDTLRARQLYINVHSTAAASGEIRGQILPAADHYYSTNLLGSNEVPSVMTSAFGALNFDLTGDQLVVTGSFNGLAADFASNIAGGSHLHLGFAGQNGGIQIPLVATVNPDMRSGYYTAAQNTFTITPEQAEALAGHRIYANVHSTQFAGGEIRGQVVGMPLAVFRAHLAGCNETPVVTSLSDGSVLGAFINDSLLVVSGSFDNLESDFAAAVAGGAHIHLGAAGQNGGIQFPLTSVVNANNRGGTFAPGANTFTITPAQRTALFARGLYANVHSVDHPSGEIRGQVLPESQMVFTAILTGAFEVLPVLTPGTGQLKAELLGNQLVVSGSFGNLTSEVATNIGGGAHLHLGFAGQNGPVEFPLTATLGPNGMGGLFAAGQNTFTLTTEQAGILRSRGYYANIHTMNNTPGEIRGQVLSEAVAYFAGSLSAAGETPAINSIASGMTILEVNRGRGILTGSFNALSSDFAANIAGGSHIHFGMAGQNGPIVRMLQPTVSNDNRSGVFRPGNNGVALSPGFVDTLRTRAFYVNIHSTDYPSGELRAQLMPLANAYFMANLTGFNEVQPNPSTALGEVKLELLGNTLSVSGSFSNLTSDFNAAAAGGAHLHLAPPGNNGGIDIPLTSIVAPDMRNGIFPARDNTYSLTNEQITALGTGNYYANVHSTGFPGGEVRGQALHEINFFPSAEATITSPTDGANVLITGDPSIPFTAEWTEAGDRDQLAYIWQLSLTQDFTTVVFQINVADNLAFATDFGTIDGLLEGLGVAVGNTITLWHRAVASDGSLATPGLESSVSLTRGVVTGTAEPTLFGISANLYPTITTGALTLHLESEKVVANGQLKIVSTQGQLISTQALNINQGAQDIRFDVSPLAQGVYFLVMQMPDGNLVSKRFIIQR